jgi:hypothetical protein
MSRQFSSVAWAWCVVSAAAAVAVGEEQAVAPQGSEIQWQEDYTQATRQAISARKMLCIFFHDPRPGAARQTFESFEKRSLTPGVLRPFADRYVWVKAPTDATITAPATAACMAAW